MTKRTVLTCKVTDAKNWSGGIGKTFKLINPFGRQSSGLNDPENIMALEWGAGGLYTFEHRYTRIYPEEKKAKNTVSISAECGQNFEELLSIDPDQEITEVTIRGVKYVPE